MRESALYTERGNKPRSLFFGPWLDRVSGLRFAACGRLMHRSYPSDRNAHGAWTSCVEHAPDFVEPTRFEIGFQQRELHKIELYATAGDAFPLVEHRRNRVNRAGPVLACEGGEATGEGRELAASSRLVVGSR
jgi:hypothetical protein